MASGASEALWVLLPTAQQRSGAWIDDTLKARVRERGLEGQWPLAGQFPRQRVEVVRDADPYSAVNDRFYRRGWTDGLPIVPPTVGRVEEMLTASELSPETVLAELEPLQGVATVEKVAVNAVMAGCRPEHLPIVLAAVQAIADPAFNLRGVQTTDENVAPLLIVNGPAARTLALNSSFGALGPGWQANATIGRALRLVMQNLGGGWPAVVSFAGLGQPGRYTLCIAENDAQSPWPPLHVDLGHAPDSSTVTVLRAETVINVTGGLPEIASVIGSAASNFTILHGGKVAVLLAPATARELAAKGWSKDDVRESLHREGRLSTEVLKQSWLFTSAYAPAHWPEGLSETAATGRVPAVRQPEDIIIVVAGGDIPIAQHAYCPSWGFPPCCVTREIHMPAIRKQRP